MFQDSLKTNGRKPKRLCFSDEEYSLYFEEGRDKMNKKGQLNIGAFLTIFIGIIVALILLGGISPFLGVTRNSVTAVNHTYTIANTTTPTDLAGQELLSTPIVTNATADADVITATGNYIIDEGISATTGLKTVQFVWDVAGSNRSGMTAINISYDYGADGYIENSAGRSMVLLIPIFAALAIIVFALSPTLRSDILNKLGK